MNAPAAGKSAHSAPKRKRFPVRLVAAALVVVAGAGGFFAWKAHAGREDGIEQYQIVSVQRGDIEDLVTATGTMQPREYVDVGAQVSGQLNKIHVEIGSVVEAGDLLAEIDPTVYRANVDARRALLRNQRATLADRESQLDLAQIQLARQKNLMAGDATTVEALQSAQAAVRSARAQLQALQAQIEQTESTLRADEANLQYARILAPMKGVVVSITARQGQALNASQQAPTLLRIADLSTMTVQAQVSEADVGQLWPGMEVYFTTLGSRNRRWYGKLRKVEPTPVVTNNVVLYNALFDVPNTQRNLLPQMTAQVFFVSASAKDALIVPASAVDMRRGGDARGNAKRGDAGQGGEQRSWRDMNPEQRHAAFDRMAPEERQAMRARRRAAAEGGGQEAARTQTGERRRGQAAAAAASPRKPTEVWAGLAAAPDRAPRSGIVRVVDADGRIAERKVEVGISNRVQVQILSGLSEGERVIAGLKQPDGAARERAARNPLQGGPGMGRRVR